MVWIKRKLLHYLIDTAGSLELSDIVMAVVHRYAELFVKEEVIFLSVPKYDREERSWIIRAALEMDQSVE
mgnify:CR=1 FL=1